MARQVKAEKNQLLKLLASQFHKNGRESAPNIIP